MPINKGLGLYIHNLIGGVGTGPQGPCHPRTYGTPRWIYGVSYENVLQSYRHKQLNTVNTQLQEYTEVPGEAICGTECKKNFQRPGLSPGPRAGGAYSAPPDSLVGGERDWLPTLQLPPAVGPFGPRFSCSPHQNCAPT